MANKTKLEFYVKKKTKFDTIFREDNGARLRSLIEGSKDINLSWEIPKGRKHKKETRIDCAVREFKEETGFGIKNYTLLFDVRPINEIFVNMGIKYIHNYYMAFAHSDFIPKNTFCSGENMCEVDSVKWVSIEELKFLDTEGRLMRAVSKAINIMKCKHIHMTNII